MSVLPQGAPGLRHDAAAGTRLQVNELARRRGGGLGPALRSFRDETRSPDRTLAEGLSALYIVTELRRTRLALLHADLGAEMLSMQWLERWRGQHRWLAVNAAWVPWLLAFQV